MSVQQAVDALVQALGTDVVATGPAIPDRRHGDWSGVPASVPRALLRPYSTEQLTRMLQICNDFGQPVVAQGGLTGLAGGACCGPDEVAVSLERMNAIEEVDAISGTLTVQAGCTLQAVQEAAEAAGFLFALDLGARGSCTIGGNLSTNAGGNRVIRYGTMRDQVLGIEAVLADGSVVGGLHKMVKNNTGYDFRHLLAGAEGTLGIVTRVVLQAASATALGGHRLVRPAELPGGDHAAAARQGGTARGRVRLRGDVAQLPRLHAGKGPGTAGAVAGPARHERADGKLGRRRRAPSGGLRRIPGPHAGRRRDRGCRRGALRHRRPLAVGRARRHGGIPACCCPAWRRSTSASRSPTSAAPRWNAKPCCASAGRTAPPWSTATWATATCT